MPLAIMGVVVAIGVYAAYRMVKTKREDQEMSETERIVDLSEHTERKQ